MVKLLLKTITFVLMVIAPIVTGKALYEYLLVKYLNQKPSYPFGSEIMKNIQVNDISYLANYTSQMLSIGIVFLTITVLIYLSILVKTLFKLAKIAMVLFVFYLIYYYLKYS